ncbi:Cornichon protein [Spironucleus salmonicida]|uniref:Cornichon protein n=1 Tax=Spironucleus salmonicida TaxID=348837 RepID=V6LPM8_9EUKA|nr:Cornichon protein [Spironucleus salmonicida]|eukprot:EST46178.1 Cornichon protein [Spironucleus salmonicida]
MSITAWVLAFLFFLALGYIGLQLYLYNLQMNVQSPPYDTSIYAEAVNKFCQIDVYSPFVFPFLFLVTGQWLGLLLSLPMLGLNIHRIVKKEIKRHSTVIYQVVQNDSNITLGKTFNMFIVWVYCLIKFILVLVL